VSILSRFADEVILVFDADEAGAKAAERGLEMFLAQQVQVRVATIPSGKDPCDYVLSEGAQAFGELIDSAPDALSYVWALRQQALADAGDNLARRNHVTEEFLQLVANSAAWGAIDEVRKGQLAQHISHLLRIPLSDLQSRMHRLARRSRPDTSTQTMPTPQAANTGGQIAAERRVLEVLLNEPELFDDVVERIGPDDFVDAALRAIAHRVWQLGHEGKLTADQVIACEEMASLGGLIAELADQGARRGNGPKTLMEAAHALLYRRERAEQEKLKSSTDDDSLRELTNRLRQADPRRRPKII
jgi:DNA primase